MSLNTAKVLDSLHGLGFTEVTTAWIDQKSTRYTVGVETPKGNFERMYENGSDEEAAFGNFADELRIFLDE